MKLLPPSLIAMFWKVSQADNSQHSFIYILETSWDDDQSYISEVVGQTRKYSGSKSGRQLFSTLCIYLGCGFYQHPLVYISGSGAH